MQYILNVCDLFATITILQCNKIIYFMFILNQIKIKPTNFAYIGIIVSVKKNDVDLKRDKRKYYAKVNML